MSDVLGGTSFEPLAAAARPDDAAMALNLDLDKLESMNLKGGAKKSDSEAPSDGKPGAGEMLKLQRLVEALFKTAQDGTASELQAKLRPLTRGECTPKSALATTKDANDRTALHFAAGRGNVDTCTEILKCCGRCVGPFTDVYVSTSHANRRAYG